MEVSRKKTAVIYSRVSTTDQKDKGFSLGNQTNDLKAFCEKNNIEIVKEYEEDYSAKTFARPEFSKLLTYCTKNKKKVDYLLVHKWCRYSRNISEAYQFMDVFKGLGIEVNAIEQWIDFDVPQNIMMLSIHLSIPEIDNKDRSLKVIAGSRAALKEGRWIYSQPIGYKSGKDERGRTLMQLDEPKASIIRRVFQDFASGSYSQKDLMKKYSCSEVKFSKSNINRILKNMVYAGMIPIPEYQKEPSQIVKGLHDPIIPLELFEKVQYVLGKKSRYKNKPTKHDENLPLRGSMSCPNCGLNLTGSGSLSKTGKKHYYYHCNTRKGCSYRMPVEIAHEKFFRSLENISPSPESIELFREMVKESICRSGKHVTSKIDDIGNRISYLTKQKEGLLDKLLDGTVADEIYKKRNSRIDEELYELKEKKLSLSKSNGEIKEHLDYAVYFLSNVNEIFMKASFDVKQKILSSILAEKLVIEKNKSRTPVFTNAILLLSRYSKGLEGAEIKKGGSFSTSSLNVLETGLEPVRPQWSLDFKSSVSTNSTTRA